MNPATRALLAELIAPFLNDDEPWDSAMDAMEAGQELAGAVQGALNEDPTLWVLSLDHQYGTDVFIYPTEADARNHVARYVSEWWTTEAGLEAEEMPEDQDEAIDAYYATVREESFLITETTIKETA